MAWPIHNCGTRHRLPEWFIRFLRLFEMPGSDAFRLNINLPWPFRSAIVIPKQRGADRYPRGWRHWHKLRFRTCLATLLINWSFSQCPGCGQRLTMRELSGKGQEMVRYESGTRWHKGCHDMPSSVGAAMEAKTDA